MRSVKVLFLVALIFLSASVSRTQTTTWQQGIVMDQMEMMPVAFTENKGQFEERTLFKGQIGGATFYFSQNEVAYLFIRETNELIKEDFGTMAPMSMTPDEFDRPRYKKEALLVKAQFVGANPNARIVGGNRLPHNNNYFLGNDPTKWRTDVPNYKSVIYKDVYPGIDLKYYGNGRSMKYDFIVNPGADISKIKIGYEGVQNLSVTAPGDLVAQTNFGPLHEKAPVIYQEIGGIKKQVKGRYEIKEPGVFGFALQDSCNRSSILTIDPELVYSTFLGGTNLEGGYNGSIANAVDIEGNVYLMGNTESPNLPVENPYDGDYNGAKDIFVAKLSSAGNSLSYCTYLGGTGEEEAGYQMAVDADGNAYVTGHTASSDFPTVNAYDGTLDGNQDVFVAKLSNLGNSLLYSTYLGGSSSDFLGNVTVDQTGNAYVTGQTYSTDFPMVNPYQPSHIGGGQDAFIAKLSPTGSSLLYSTYLGGSNTDCGFSIAIDQANNIYIMGRTWSSDFPTANAYQNTFGGAEDAFVAELSAAGNSLVYSTYLGGGARDGGCAIALDNIQNLYVAGWTQSSNFPTVNPFDGSLGGTADAIIAKFSPSGSLLYSTYLGGSDVDQALGIAVDSATNVYVTGQTGSNDFWRVNPYDGTYNGNRDAFVAKLKSSGHSFFYTTYLGGSDEDLGMKIAVDRNNNAYVAGYTFSSNFPTLHAFDSTYNGGGDAFVTKIWDESPPVPFPNISVADTFHSFSALKVGETEDWTLVVHNTGDGDLVIDSTTDSSVFGNGGFSVVSPSFPQTVPLGDSLLVVVRFAPSGFGGYGSYIGEIRIWSNDWDQPKVSVWLGGQKQWEYIFVCVIGNSGTGLSASAFYNDLPETLSQDGRDMWVEDRAALPLLTDISPYISFIDQLWIVSGESSSVLTPEEIQLIVDFHNSGKGVLIIGDGCNYNAPANQLAPSLGVEFVSSHCCDCDHCSGPVGCEVSTLGFTPHAIWNNVSQIQANQSEGDLSATSPAQVIATHSGINMVAVREGNGGRVAWDASFYRFSNADFNPDLSITHYDNAKYVRNLANWLAGGGAPPTVEPNVSLSANSHDFGEVQVGTTQDWTLVIINTGNATLTINSITSDNSVFTVTSPTFPNDIPQGGNLSVNVRFGPVEPISYSGNLSINSNDPDQPVFRVAVLGMGQVFDGVGGIVYDPSSPLFDPSDLAKSGIPYAEVKIYVCSAIDYIYNGDLPTVYTDQSGRYRIDLSNCGVTSARFLTIEVHSNNYNPTRIPDVYQVQSAFISLDIALSSNQLELAKPYKTPEGHFSIAYETAGSDECFESEIMSAFHIQENGLSVFKKTPTTIFELGRSLEYALKKYVEFGFLQLDEGQYPITVKVEDVPVSFGLQPSAHGKFSPGQAGAIYINATEAHKPQLPATDRTQFYYWLGTDAAHELFHHVQWIRMGRPISDDIIFPLLKPRSVIEGTAVWAENLVFPPHRPSVVKPSYLTWTDQVFKSPYQHSGLASDLCSSEPYQGPAAFWTFLSEQTGEVVNFKDLYDCSRIAYGPGVIKDLLYSGADLSALDKVIEEQWKGNETRYTLYYRWQVANISKDYGFHPSEGPDTLKILYRQYRAASGVSIYRHFYYAPLSIPDNWKCEPSLNSYHYLGETAPLRNLYNDCAAYFQVSPQPEVKAIAIQPFYESNVDLDADKDVMPCDVTVFVVNTQGLISSIAPGIKHFNMPEGASKIIVMLSNTNTISGNYPNVGLGVFAHDGTQTPHFEIGVICPVQLIVTLPSGYQVSPGSPSPANAFFINDTLESGRSIKGISFLGPEAGLYKISLSPDSTALPTDSFSLYALLGADTIWLAKNVKIVNIPPRGYLFNSLAYASLCGFVAVDSSQALLGVNVDIYDSAGTLFQSVVTDDSGYYHVDSIPNGDYTISVVTPLGYQADQETKEFTINHVPVTVNFSLTKLAITPRQRSCAYWTDQLCKALQNKPKDYTRANFSRFAGLINIHFNQNEVNPVNFYTVPQPANQNDSLMVMKKILTLCNNQNDPYLKRLAKAQLMTLMLNVVSGKIHQTQTISADNRTVSQAITFCDQLIGGEITCPDNIPGHNNPNCPCILSGLILTLINVGATVPRDLIPANVIQIAYDIHIPESVPEHFALNQNYPNPFNPMCEISYALPTDCHVSLTIYNILGQRVKTLVDEHQNAGNKSVKWDGKDDQGQEVTSGIYFYRIKAGDFVQSKKMVLLR